MKINQRLNSKIRNYTALVAIFTGIVAAVCDALSDRPIFSSSSSSLSKSKNTNDSYYINKELERLHEQAEQELTKQGYVSLDTRRQIQDLTEKL